jgi:hypothetical protein
VTTRATHCADCGEQLDRFGMCPFADANRGRVERAPVNCGRTAIENTKMLRQTIAAAVYPAAHPADQVLRPKFAGGAA